MRRKLDMSGLTDDEAEHVLQVVQRDMKLRKKEDERLSELKQELDEEGSRCSLLSRQHRFNERCCIRCCSPFTFLVNPKRPCLDCKYNICKTCRSYSKKDKAWVCSACQKGRLLKTQSLEWYYNNVKCRFKRFGSAKVLKTLYRKHLAEHGTLGELTEGSTYEESIGNEGSVCSENAFYRQSEEHSMAETLTVALRVAEEAIDEAIAKAEGHTDSQDKQSEARYLRDHREELIEELATTIVQKRSHSAFSLLDDNVMMQCSGVSQDSQHGLKKEGGAAGLANWKSVDRLDNSSASSVLKSPDGNWIAQQSTQLSRPSLLTKRKSLVFSVLEKESGVISAYDEMGSDDAEGGEGAWGAALLEIRRKMTNANNNQGSEAPDSQASDDQQHSLPSPLLDHHASTDTLNSESEVGEDQIRGQGPKPQKPLLAILKRKVPVEHRCTPSSRRSSRPGIFDVNFNPEGMEAESSGADELEEGGKVRRTRRRKRTKKDQGEGRGEVKRDSLSLSLVTSITLISLIMLDIHFISLIGLHKTCVNPIACVQRYSAMSLRSITTEVLTVLNATEDLLQGVEEGDYACSPPYTPSLPLNTDTKRLGEQLSRLEENVYVAAGTAYGLEAELDDLEECARAIDDSTSDLELSYLEEQVASAAAQVHQSDLQVSDIAARITALKNAGLNVVPQNRFTKPKKQPKVLDQTRSLSTRTRSLVRSCGQEQLLALLVTH
uniref:Myosin VIIA and Rab interacting protein a n=1 Tax=Oncorhynchus kisutch TaxID=8019 RepID=A0A8C7MXH4_ONCKI